MFVINPFTNNPNDRLYRTGELGRYSPDGNVEWAGRNDRRVNIRGFRVELEEIEAILKQHPIVNDAAVIVQEFDDLNTDNSISDWRLVAYIVADEEGDSLIDLLRSFLGSQLPDYMVPAHFLVLKSLPLNLNGKIDYQALPSPQISSGSAIFTSPRNEIETRLCAVFAEVLGRRQVGIDENFFRIGGHSLLAARAAARISDGFGVELELLTFLEMPTVVALAKKVESLLSGGQMSTQSDKDEREEFDL
jgi:acyl carrier protein